MEGRTNTEAPRLCVLLHGNGFNKGVWRPVVDELAALFDLKLEWSGSEVVSLSPGASLVRLGSYLYIATIDLLGHGGAPPVELNGSATDWSQFARHIESLVADCVEALPVSPSEVVAVCHSLGGGCALLAQHEATKPLFCRLLVYEPMYLFVTPQLCEASGMPGGDPMHRPVVQRTLRRRARWASKAEAFSELAKKPLYASLDRRAFEGFLSDGFVGHGPVQLACAPETEATIFGSGTSPAFVEALQATAGNALKGATLHVCMGTGRAGWTPQIASLLFGALHPQPTISVIDGGGHMWPFEQPAEFARMVARTAIGAVCEQVDGTIACAQRARL